MPIERKAPGVIYRQPVNEPLQTGIKAIDSMIPVGRGQRELIIGDRQTGKTTVALIQSSTKKNFTIEASLFIAYTLRLAQKGSTVAGIVKTLGRSRSYGLHDSLLLQTHLILLQCSFTLHFRCRHR